MQQPPVMPQRGRDHFPFLRHHHDSPGSPAPLAESGAPMQLPRQLLQQPAPELTPSPTPQPALSPGTVLVNRYLIEGYIGGGGFAHIYRARDLTFRQRRAIKEAFAYDAQTRTQFRLEGEFLLNMQHPNLVRGYACFEHAGRLYLVMEYVDGQTLEDIAIDHIRRTHRALPEWQVLDWMIPICEAVHTLHAQPVPIIHRDIKPANIKLSRETGIPTLIDLGLAKLYAEGMPTIAAALAFTPGYAPPEQYHAAGQTDRRTDVYALGATLFFLLTGFQPTESPARLTTQTLPAPRSLNPALSIPAEAIVLRAMALNPDERHQTAAALAMDLRAACASLGGPTALAQGDAASGAVTSGGQVPSRACARCGATSPASARFCMQCGGALTVESPVAQRGGSAPGRGATGTDPQALGSGAAGALRASSGAPLAPGAPRMPPPPARAIPTPPHAPALVYASGAAPRAGIVGLASGLAVGHAAPSPLEVEAAASILALLSLVCVALSLMGAIWAPLLLFVVVGLGLAHWVIGNPWHAWLASLPIGETLEQHAWLRWLLWPGMPMPREFKLIALAALIVGYFWLIATVAQLFYALGHP
jgi:hypothetical protein